MPVKFLAADIYARIDRWGCSSILQNDGKAVGMGIARNNLAVSAHPVRVAMNLHVNFLYSHVRPQLLFGVSHSNLVGSYCRLCQLRGGLNGLVGTAQFQVTNDAQNARSDNQSDGSNGENYRPISKSPFERLIINAILSFFGAFLCGFLTGYHFHEKRRLFGALWLDIGCFCGLFGMNLWLSSDFVRNQEPAESKRTRPKKWPVRRKHNLPLTFSASGRRCYLLANGS